MERFQSGLFRRIVLIHMLQALVLSITGIVDSVIVGQFWEAEGLAGMKLAMPVFSILLMVGSILSTGLSVQVTKFLAKGKRAEANQCFVWVCMSATAISLILTLAAILIPDTITGFFADYTEDVILYEDVKAYLIPILTGNLVVIMQIVLSGVAALEGADRRLTASIAVILVSDIIGDLIAVYLDAGIRGIAIASVAAYLCTCLVLGGQLLSGKTIFHIGRPHMVKGMLTAVLITGFPMAVRFMGEFIYPMAVNRMMLHYGSINGLAALSIQDAVRYMPLALGEGVMTATLLLTGMFAAEHDMEALRRERRDILRCCTINGSVLAVILALAAPLIVKLFTKDYMLQELSASAFRWYLLGVPFMCFNLSVRAYLQGLDKQKEASILTLINQLALPVLITLLLGRYWGVPGIFAAFAVHEIVLAIGFACLQYVMRRNGRSFSDAAALGRLIAEIRGDITTLEQVTEASEKVIGLCRENGVDNRQAYNIGLCLEELAANSLLHGFKDDREKYMEYRFIIIGRWLILRLRDNGRPFDLTERYKLLDPDDPASGMGLRIVFAAAENVNYSHAFDLNNVCIRVLKQSSREKTEKQ
ncbi:MAG: ATP-binding protein [Mogibacterium sp.]|nr:ATP-binding protein [Mogibacterium sp.]